MKNLTPIREKERNVNNMGSTSIWIDNCYLDPLVLLIFYIFLEIIFRKLIEKWTTIVLNVVMCWYIYFLNFFKRSLTKIKLNWDTRRVHMDMNFVDASIPQLQW